jgi:hypothetical protein
MDIAYSPTYSWALQLVECSTVLAFPFSSSGRSELSVVPEDSQTPAAVEIRSPVALNFRAPVESPPIRK